MRSKFKIKSLFLKTDSIEWFILQKLKLTRPRAGHLLRKHHL